MYCSRFEKAGTVVLPCPAERANPNMPFDQSREKLGMGDKEKVEGMLSPYQVLDLTDEKGLLCGQLVQRCRS